MCVHNSFTLVRMASSWRMTQHGYVIPSLVTPWGLALPETACPPKLAATTEGQRSTSPELDSPCIPRSVTVSKNDIHQEICIISGEANILRVIMLWDLARGLLCGLTLKLPLATFLTCHMLPSHLGATMSKWTGKPKITWHRKKSKIFYINRIILEWFCRTSTTKTALKNESCQNANLPSPTPQVFLDWQPVVPLVTTKLSAWQLPSFQLMWRVDGMSCCVFFIADGVARVRV